MNDVKKYGDDSLGIKQLYSVPIYTTIATNVASIQKEIRSVIDQIEIGTTPEWWGRTHKLSLPKDKSAFAFDQDVIGEYGMIKLSQEIDNQVKYYCNNVGLSYTSKYKRTSWLAVFDENEYGHIHNHFESPVAGCYYYQTGGSDGSIFFNSPSSLKVLSEYSNINGRYVVVPTVGKMILFPGPLEHGITTNTTKNRRISISFNINFIR